MNCDGSGATCRSSFSVLTGYFTLMDISEAETGTMKLEPGPVKVRDLVGQAIERYGDVAAE